MNDQRPVVMSDLQRMEASFLRLDEKVDELKDRVGSLEVAQGKQEEKLRLSAMLGSAIGTALTLLITVGLYLFARSLQH